MARDFNGTTQYATASISALGFDTGTFAAWLRPDFGPDSASQHFLFRTSGACLYYALLNSPNIIQVFHDGRTQDFDVTGLWSANAWTHFALVYNKTGNVQTLYINGSSVATSGAPSGTWGANTFGADTVFVMVNGLLNTFWGGDAAELGTYTAALDAAEIAALSKGFSPNQIRPASLNGYWPIFGNDSPELDRGKNRYELTLVNSPTKVAHPRIYYPHQVP